MSSQYRKWRPEAPAVLLAGLALAACHAAPPPTTELNRASAAIQDARLDGAELLAPSQLQSAETTLSKAQQQVSAQNMTQAKFLAEEAEMDAIYADTAANAQRAQNTANQLQQYQSVLQKPAQQ